MMQTQAITPRHQHDCEACQFLGHYGEDDLYYCPTDGDVIARFADNGPAYRSFPIAIARMLKDHSNPLYVAALLGDKR